MDLKIGFGKQIQKGFESQSWNLFQQNMSPVVGKWSSRTTKAVVVSWRWQACCSIRSSSSDSSSTIVVT